MINVLVTGGCGFIGQRLIRALVERRGLADHEGANQAIGRILALDHVHPSGLFVHELVEYVRGDVASAELLRHAIGGDGGAVFHLAAIVSGQAEADFDLGMRINLDATRALLEVCRGQRRPMRLVFSSSLAVFGGVARVDDATTPAPQTSYGIQKLIGELLVGDYARRGFVDGRSVRLPTVVVRPGKPNAAASSFASGIIREPLAGAESICPVDRATSMFVTSPEAVVAALIHAHELPAAAWGGARSVSLPGVTASVDQMLDALEEVGGAAARARVRFELDPKVDALVRTWPGVFTTERALALGFKADPDYATIVRRYAASVKG